MFVPRVIALVPLTVAIAACASYYKVTEPGSGKEFYTEKVSREIGGGTVEFKDAKTGAKTTLQNSQVLEIDKATYKAGLAAKAAPAPTASPAPPPAASPATTPAPAQK